MLHGYVQLICEEVFWAKGLGGAAIEIRQGEFKRAILGSFINTVPATQQVLLHGPLLIKGL